MRSKWKLPYINLKKLQKVKKQQKEDKKENLLFKSRNDTITLDFLKQTIKIYNGIQYVNLFVTESHIGYKTGHFTITKKRCIFKKKKNGSKN